MSVSTNSTGHIIVAGTHNLGWDGIYDIVHGAEDLVKDVGGVGGLLAWLVNTFLSAIVGIIVGGVVVAVMSKLLFGHGGDHDEAHGAAAAH